MEEIQMVLKNTIRSIIKWSKGAGAALVLTMAMAGQVQAQGIGDAGEILRASVDDAEKILQEWTRPFGTGIGAAMTSGWYNVAKTHKLLGFSVGFRANIFMVPDDQLEFDLNSLPLGTLQYAGKGGNSPVITPTFSGVDTPGTLVWIPATDPSTGQQAIDPSTGQPLGAFNLPSGINVPYTGFPTVQANVGLIKDTEIMIRVLPTIEDEEFGSFSSYGFGVKHNIKQWIPVVKRVPIDLSVYYSFSNISLESNFDVQPKVNAQVEDTYPASTWDGQGIELTSSGTSYGIIVGKSIPLISVYGGIGFDKASTELNLKGRYPTERPSTVDEFLATGKPKHVEATQENPFSLTYDNGTSLRTVVGARVKLLFLTVNADYSMGKYPVASVGAGISIR